MFDVAQAVFFHQYHSANTHRANRPISGAPVDADMSVHSHMVTPTQIHPHRTQQSYLCPLNGAAHTWLKSQEWNHNHPGCPPVQAELCPSWLTCQPSDIHRVCFVSGCGLTDEQRSSFSITQFILTPAYHLVCGTDVGGADVPPARFM